MSSGAEALLASSALSEDRCPACADSSRTSESEKESWVRCDFCKAWFHWRCVGEGGDLSIVDKWYCHPCREDNPGRAITLKPPTRKSTRKKPIRDYANLHIGSGLVDSQTWAITLSNKAFTADTFKRMAGAELSQSWLEGDPSAMSEPVIIPDPSGLGMKMPSNDITVGQIADILGADMPVEVIDVATQSGLSGWTLGRWAEYYESSERDLIRNVISLEISGTKLAEHILPPRLVREVDWVEKYWPSSRKGKGHVFPKVQLYCLMSVEGAWTDWHIDFAGSSVYYHVVKGAKTFLFIRPSPANLAAYQRWSGSEMQTHTWLGDLVDEVIRVDLIAGSTMIIPTGWIHAVHTPADALVFGGNFVHSYNAALQLRVREVEIATRVPKKFRFPLFVKLTWYVGEKTLRDLRAKEEFHPRVLESLESVACFLVSQARTMERGSEAARREAKEHVPCDRVKDPSALARELRWRIRLALQWNSDSEGSGPPYTSPEFPSKGAKRGRSLVEQDENAQFRNFQPRAWAHVYRRAERRVDHRLRVRPSEDDELLLEPWREDMVHEDDTLSPGEAVVVASRHVVTTKIRKTELGLERQRVDSVYETWTWSEAEK